MEKHATRFTNLFSFYTIFNSKNFELISRFINISSNSFPKKANSQRNIMNNDELVTLYELSKSIVNTNKLSPDQLDGFILDYTFYTGVREQFDILRFSENRVLNIELKKKQNILKMTEQLQAHKQILNSVCNNLYLFTYREEDNTIWFLNENNSINTVSIDFLLDKISKNHLSDNPLNKLDLTNTIISPYSEPDRFTEKKYFLTSDQKDAEEKILKAPQKLISLTGGAGSGKTLLLIDLAAKLASMGKRIKFIFSSLMDLTTTEELTRKFKFSICTIKNVNISALSDFDYILIDESQRLYKGEFDKFISLSKPVRIFSSDHLQTLHTSERDLKIEEKLEKLGALHVKLNEKIRSDPAMSSFIQKLLNLSAKGVQPYDYENVHVVYFDTKERASEYMTNMQKEHGYTVIEPTEYVTRTMHTKERPRIIPTSIKTHSTIGREYDKVLIPLDEFYVYKDKKLTSTYKLTGFYPYLETSLLFEGLSRVRKELLLVVINNLPLYGEILCILSWKEDKIYG